jgi:hypothetical protein
MAFPDSVYLFQSGGKRERRFKDWPWQYYNLHAFSIDPTGENLPPSDPPWKVQGEYTWASVQARPVFVSIEEATNDLKRQGWYVWEHWNGNNTYREPCDQPAAGYSYTQYPLKAEQELREKLVEHQRKKAMGTPVETKTLGWGVAILFFGCILVSLGVVTQFWGLSVFGIVVIGLSLGFATIPIAHKGVPLIWGSRIQTWVYGEGLQWVPPLFMSHIDIDMRSRAAVVIEVQAITSDKIPIRPRVSTSWKIFNPALYLGATDSIEGVAMPQAIRANVVTFLKEMTLDQALQSQGANLPSLASMASLEMLSWGIEVQSIQIADIQLDPGVTAEFERTKQLQIAADQSQVLQKAFGLSPQQAAEYIQIHRGNVSKEIKEFNLSPGVLDALKELFKK